MIGSQGLELESEVAAGEAPQDWEGTTSNRLLSVTSKSKLESRS